MSGNHVSRAISSRVIGALAAASATIFALSLLPSAALASTSDVRCLPAAGTKNIIFGPNSFFEPNTVQGPTSFRQNSTPSGPTQAILPLYQGTSQGRKVFYVITDASDLAAARVLGVSYVPKLGESALAISGAVEHSSSAIGTGHGIDFPASVDFSPQHVIAPGPDGFPPSAAQPGAVGEDGYSPLVQVTFRGHTVILNAPQVANATGQADKVISVNHSAHTVNYAETNGCYDDKSVHYVSFEASDPGAAAIEDVTYAPALDAAPSVGCADGEPQPFDPMCSRQSLIAFTNGQTGVDNPNRQGVNALLTDGHSPLNILQHVPSTDSDSPFLYSPLWDVHFETWTPAAVAEGINFRQIAFDDAVAQVAAGNATGFPAGTPFRATGFMVTCPVISLDVPPGG